MGFLLDRLDALIGYGAPDRSHLMVLVFAVALIWGLYLIWPDADTNEGKLLPADAPVPAGAQSTAAVTSMWVYPVKSCAGHAVQRWPVGRTGFEMDRLWVVVGSDGRFHSQRRLPKMALIQPSLPKNANEPLKLSAPGRALLTVPVVRASAKGATLMDVSVWGDHCVGCVTPTYNTLCTLYVSAGLNQMDHN